MDARVAAEPGDILFYRTSSGSGLLPRAIVFFQRLWGEGDRESRYYHMSVVASNVLMQFEARFPKCRESKINWSHPGIELWRIRGVTLEQRNSIVACAMNMVGEWYDVWNFVFGAFDSKHAETCATFVAKAAAAAGVRLDPIGDRFLTPNELIESPFLYRVE